MDSLHFCQYWRNMLPEHNHDESNVYSSPSLSSQSSSTSASHSWPMGKAWVVKVILILILLFSTFVVSLIPMAAAVPALPHHPKNGERRRKKRKPRERSPILSTPLLTIFDVRHRWCSYRRLLPSSYAARRGGNGSRHQ